LKRFILRRHREFSGNSGAEETHTIAAKSSPGVFVRVGTFQPVCFNAAAFPELPDATSAKPGPSAAPLNGLRITWRIAALCLVSIQLLHAQTHPHPTPKPSVRASASQTGYAAGISLIRQGRVEEAIAVFEAALQIEPRDAKLLDAAGATYLLKNDFETAKKYFLQSLELNPSFSPARKNLAIAYFNAGQYDQAESEFQKLKTDRASFPVANLFLGMLAEKKGNYASAYSLLQSAGPLVRRYPDASLALASVSIQLGKVETGRSALHFLSRSPLTAVQHVKAGELLARLGDHQGALAAFQKAQAKDPQIERLDYLRAVSLDQLNQPKDALAILKPLVAGKPDGDTLNLLAHVAEKTGDLDLAIQSLRQAAKLDPRREDNYLDFSTICADYGNFPLALEAAEVGLSNLPTSYRLTVQRGVVLENLGRVEDAEQALKDAAKLQKDNSVALLSLAIVQSHASDWAAAESTLDDAIRSFPRDYYMRYQLGKILIHGDEGHPLDPSTIAKAENAFQAAIRLKPSFADSYYQLAKLTLHADPKFAEQNLVACLHINPNHAPAQYTLARLYVSSGRRAAGQVLIDRFESQQQAAKLS
jgi:tetratricopeptide (TPR) repeat protein